MTDPTSDMIDRNVRLASNDAYETAAKACEILGDAEFARWAKKGNVGIGTLAQRHYIACAAAIRALKIVPPPETYEESDAVAGERG